ncbi:hypothetical protein [Hymenobacter sp.]|jgi:hypothetical protein|uniref:hypothetical protein n=1 Tax=Hymenobacter sp. TaxID=1898978 RepID=UPI002ED9CA78
MNNYELLDLIRRRPAMYIGRHSTTHLRCFLDGYSMCYHTAQLVIHDEVPDFGGFYDWVANKLGYSDSVRGWANRINEQRQDPEEALWLFYELLDEYRELRPRILAQVDYIQPLTPNPTLYNYYGLRGQQNFTTKPRPAILSIEEVLPNQQWVALYAKKDGIILDRWPANTVNDAVKRASEVFGVDPVDWNFT